MVQLDTFETENLKKKIVLSCRFKPATLSNYEDSRWKIRNSWHCYTECSLIDLYPCEAWNQRRPRRLVVVLYALVSVIILLTFISSHRNFTVLPPIVDLAVVFTT